MYTPAIVWCDPPDCVLTADEARAYALVLIGKADRADGGQTLSSFVTCAEVLADLEAARVALERLGIDALSDRTTGQHSAHRAKRKSTPDTPG